MNSKIKKILLGMIIGVSFGSIVSIALSTYPSDQVIYMDGDKEKVLTEYMDQIYNQVYSGNATADQIYKGKKALVNGVLLTGTGEINKIATLERKEITRSFSARTGTIVNGSYRYYEVTYNIDISGDFSDCHNINASNIAVERPTLTASPNGFGGHGLQGWTYDSNTCTVSVTQRARKGFSYGSVAETYKVIIFYMKEKTV